MSVFTRAFDCLAKAHTLGVEPSKWIVGDGAMDAIIDEVCDSSSRPVSKSVIDAGLCEWLGYPLRVDKNLRRDEIRLINASDEVIVHVEVVA